MKIGILSLPLTWNYGGILQQYALKKSLNDLEHDAQIISRRQNRNNPIIKFMVWFKWNFLKQISNISLFHFLPLVAAEPFKNKYLYAFMSRNIYSEKDMYAVAHKGNFNAFIVGSDQVWNYTAAPQILNYYFDFAQDMQNIKRIAYSASFARKEWIYPDEITQKCKELVALFDAVSVREEDAIGLCKKYLDKEAIHLCDPTLLLNKKDYVDLIKAYPSKYIDRLNENILFCYVLDITEEKKQYIEIVAKELGLEPFYFHEMSKKKMFGRHLNGFDPTVESWLQCFDKAKYVITDSFHGTVFSIIFNKPFLAIANEKRGLARFTSLLDMFSLTDRLISDISLINLNLLSSEIEWTLVNSLKLEEQNKSICFFTKQLN